MTQIHRDPCPHPDCREPGPRQDPTLLERVEAGIERLYQAHFYGRSWLASWAADVGTLAAMTDTNPDWRQVFIEHVAQHTDHTCCFRQELEQRRTQ